MRSRVCLGNREWSALCEGCDNGRGRVSGTYGFSATGDGVCEKRGYQHSQTVGSYQHRICYQEELDGSPTVLSGMLGLRS